MHLSLTTHQFAIAAVATLLAGGLLSSAKAEGEGRAASRGANQPAWYRLWNELSASQKSEPSDSTPRPDTPGNRERRLTVSVSQLRDEGVNVGASTTARRVPEAMEAMNSDAAKPLIAPPVDQDFPKRAGVQVVPASFIEGWHLKSRVDRTGNIQLEVATLHRLRLNGPIERIEVADRQVCEAWKQADHEIHLLAKRNGETKVTIHYATAQTPEIYAVKVGSFQQQDEADGDLRLEALIAEMFPESRVLLNSSGQSLVVSGAARDNAEAVRILSFVRSLRLVPVADKLTVRR